MKVANVEELLGAVASVRAELELAKGFQHVREDLGKLGELLLQ